MRFISHLILLLAVTATLAFAQAQQPQRPSDDELNAMFATSNTSSPLSIMAAIRRRTTRRRQCHHQRKGR